MRRIGVGRFFFSERLSAGFSRKYLQTDCQTVRVLKKSISNPYINALKNNKERLFE